MAKVKKAKAGTPQTPAAPVTKGAAWEDFSTRRMYAAEDGVVSLYAPGRLNRGVLPASVRVIREERGTISDEESAAAVGHEGEFAALIRGVNLGNGAWGQLADWVEENRDDGQATEVAAALRKLGGLA